MITTSEIHAISLLPKIGKKTMLKLVVAIESLEIQALDPHSLDRIEANNRKLAPLTQRLKRFSEDEKNKMRQESENIFSECKKLKVGVVSYLDKSYPKALKGNPDAPIFLYFRGNFSLFDCHSLVAVIGSRDCTQTGKLVCERSVANLVQQGHVIVSGLASGIDEIAHKTVLGLKGQTIAVVVDVLNITPRSNIELANDILVNEGLVISENPPNIKVLPGLFVLRDKIQSAISKAVFVIETTEKGGSMHCARTSLLNGKPVFVPDPSKIKYNGSNVKYERGSQELIKLGAKVYSSANYTDVFEEIESA